MTASSSAASAAGGSDPAGSAPLAAAAGRRTSSRVVPEERRRARRIAVLRGIFVVGLIAWASLTAWWGTYLYLSVQQIREITLRAYQAEERLLATALRSAGAELTPELALHDTPYALERLPLSEEADEFPSEIIGEAFPGLAVVVHPDERARLRKEQRSKTVMLVGEGTLLLSLLFVCYIGLYRTILGEWRLQRQTETFIHTVTHELKSPIAGLRALLQSLKTLDLGREERGTFLGMGLAEVERLDRLVGNVLLSSRLEGTGFTPRLTRVDVPSVAQRVVERKRLLFEQRGGTLEAELPPGLQARADEEVLEIVLDNLLDNALKYGGHPPWARVSATLASGGVRLAVEDHGTGLPPEEAQRVFEKFYRAREAEDRPTKGTGLGLFIARRLARACGGDLSVEPRPGEGARFHFDLTA